MKRFPSQADDLSYAQGCPFAMGHNPTVRRPIPGTEIDLFIDRGATAGGAGVHLVEQFRCEGLVFNDESLSLFPFFLTKGLSLLLTCASIKALLG
jgi:hypothetical protein